MNYFSLFTAAAASAVAVSSFATPASAASEHSFTDVGSRYEEAVSFLYEIEVINGLSATKFGTQQTLTRGDAAVILAKMLMLDTVSAPDAGFKDVNTRIKGSVNALAELGVISGVTKTEFKPSEPLSRGAMAKFLVTAFELEEYSGKTPFTDVGGVFQPYIESLYATGVTSGKTATSYGTTSNIARGEFANLLYGTFTFVVDNSYFPVVVSAKPLNTTTTQVVLAESVPEEYSATDAGQLLFYLVSYNNEEPAEFEPGSFSLSQDRKTLTVFHPEERLGGKKGYIIIEDFESEIKASFDFTASSQGISASFVYEAALPATTAE